MFTFSASPIGRWFAALAAALSLILLAAPARAVDYFWTSPSGGSFTNPANWQPLNPGLGQIGAGGASDTVNFDLGVPTASRYLVSGVAGANDRLLVHKDSLTLNLSGNYRTAGRGMDTRRRLSPRPSGPDCCCCSQPH